MVKLANTPELESGICNGFRGPSPLIRISISNNFFKKEKKNAYYWMVFN